MDWTRAIDGYCERLGPGYWAEPVNAVTNLAFVLVALWLWPRSRGVERLLCAILGLIGIGSWLFHTHATGWAALADILPIAAFILVYVYAANRIFLGVGRLGAGFGVLLFALYLPFAARGIALVPGLSNSAVYWPVPLAIAGYALWLRDRLPRVASGLAIGAGLLSLSLAARSLDMPLCEINPLGTHFAWHLLNAVMLGWMITVLGRHRLERDGQGR